MKNKLKKINLPIIVFLTGACVLIIEVVATRILSPYYGNTIFTVSSVISIVLAALSLGYYFGGMLADKYPSAKFFYSIILLSGLSVMLLRLLMIFFLPSFGYRYSIISGPIISSFFLFFLPSLLLGALSPFAIKLQWQNFPEKGIGSITGEIFFYSTLGSIMGSLLAGFVLIPRFGINHIILSIAILLIILGFVPLLSIGISRKSILRIFIFCLLGTVLSVFSLLSKKENVVYSQDGIYEKITIYDAKYAGKPARFFQQDRSDSGAIFLETGETVFDYAKYYILYKIFKPEIKNAIVLGGGAYIVPKDIHKDFPDAKIDIAEIEADLFQLSQKYFGLPESNQIENFTEDGRRLLHDSEKKYDMIFSDVFYSLYSIPSHFATQEFYKIAKDRLNKDGVFIANIIGDLSPEKPSFILSEIKTFQTIFPNCYFFASNDPESIYTQNIIFVGYNSDIKIDFEDSKIKNNESEIIRSLNDKLVNLNKFDFSNYPVLTDNFSPVEYFTSGVIRRSFLQ